MLTCLRRTLPRHRSSGAVSARANPFRTNKDSRELMATPRRAVKNIGVNYARTVAMRRRSQLGEMLCGSGVRLEGMRGHQVFHLIPIPTMGSRSRLLFLFRGREDLLLVLLDVASGRVRIWWNVLLSDVNANSSARSRILDSLPFEVTEKLRGVWLERRKEQAPPERTRLAHSGSLESQARTTAQECEFVPFWGILR